MARAKKPAPAPPPPPEPPKPKRPRGNKAQGKPYEPNEEARALIRVMVAGGIQQAAIAAALRIDTKTLAKYYRHELDNGLAQANANVVARLYKMTADNVRAVEFWLTNRDKKNWAHTQKVAVDQNFVANIGERLTRAQQKLRQKGK